MSDRLFMVEDAPEMNTSVNTFDQQAGSSGTQGNLGQGGRRVRGTRLNGAVVAGLRAPRVRVKPFAALTSARDYDLVRSGGR